jgi:hypothetical protein
MPLGDRQKTTAAQPTFKYQRSAAASRKTYTRNSNSELNLSRSNDNVPFTPDGPPGLRAGQIGPGPYSHPAAQIDAMRP